MRSPVTNGCRFILTISGLSMHLILNQALFPLNSGPIAVRLLQLRIAPSGLLLNRAKPQLLFKPPLQVFSRQATCGLFQWSFALDKDQLAQKRHKEGQRHTQCLYWELAPLSLWFRPIACEYIRMVLQKQSFRFFFFLCSRFPVRYNHLYRLREPSVVHVHHTENICQKWQQIRTKCVAPT